MLYDLGRSYFHRLFKLTSFATFPLMQNIYFLILPITKND